MKRDKQKRDILLSVADDLYAWINAYTEDMSLALESLASLAWHSEIAYREDEDGDIRTWGVSHGIKKNLFLGNNYKIKTKVFF